MRTLLIAVVAGLILSPAPLVLESQPSGSLRGRVMTGGGSDLTPVRRARVTLEFDDGLTPARVTQTDTNGGYAFDRVPFAKPTITVHKPGFVKIRAAATPDATLIMVRAGAIEGVVTDARGEPLLNMSVAALRRQDNNAAPKLVAESRTDDLGRYRLHTLPEGDYIVEAATDQIADSSMVPAPREKPWEISAVFYPAEVALDRARPVRVSIGQTTTGIDLVLTPPERTTALNSSTTTADSTGTARIVGRVVESSSGKPVANAEVILMPVEGAMPSNWRRTDARGRFEFDRLLARQYALRAYARRFVPIELGQKRLGEPGARIEIRDGEVFTADMRLPRASAIDVTVVDEFGDPVPGIIVQAARKWFRKGRQRLIPVPDSQTARTDDQGRYRISGLTPADYYVSALPGVYAGADEVGGFTPTYYPGTPDAVAAAPVSIALGTDATATIALRPAKIFSLSGVVVDATGKPTNGRGTVLLVTAGSQQRLESNVARAETSPDGHFVLRNVPQGIYTLQGFGPPARGYTGTFAADFGMLPVSVADADLDDLLITVTAGTSFRGRVVLDGGGVPPLRMTDFHIAALPAELDSAPIDQELGFGMNDDFTFEVPRLFGTLRIVVWTATSALALKRITRNDVDITDTPLDFRRKDIDGVEVVLTARVSRVTGSVSDDNGTIDDYAVVIFASDPTKWFEYSRFVRVGRATSDGRFEVRGLPPEDYFAVALPRVVEDEWRDPEFLDRLRPLATSFTLSEGESKTLQLKLRQRP